jgi:hypothetical protein
MSHIGGTNDARNLEDEFAVLARETPAAIDDEPGTTMRAGEARLSYPHDEFDEDGDELTLFAIPIASLSRRVRFFLSVSATLFFYGNRDKKIEKKKKKKK